jgi:hypothetical protein
MNFFDKFLSSSFALSASYDSGNPVSIIEIFSFLIASFLPVFRSISRIFFSFSSFPFAV